MEKRRVRSRRASLGWLSARLRQIAEPHFDSINLEQKSTLTLKDGVTSTQAVPMDRPDYRDSTVPDIGPCLRGL